jgi:hypothetical protein
MVFTRKNTSFVYFIFLKIQLSTKVKKRKGDDCQDKMAKRTVVRKKLRAYEVRPLVTAAMLEQHASITVIASV